MSGDETQAEVVLLSPPNNPPWKGWSVSLPLHTVSEANKRRHWRGRAQRAREQRTAVAFRLRAAVGLQPPPLPILVTMTRVAPRRLDSDNLASALKACRDGAADWLRVDDRDPLVVWRYQQRKGQPREYAVEVAMEPLVYCERCGQPRPG